MATYTELHSLFNDEALIHKVRVAIVEAARIVGANEDTAAPFSQSQGAHDKRVLWSRRAVTQTGTEAANMFKLVLAANKGATVSQIQTATDAAIQSNINTMVDVMAEAIAAGQG